MPLFPRLLTLLLLMAGTAHLPAATMTSKSKAQGKSSGTTTVSASSKSKGGSASKSGTSTKPKAESVSSAQPDTLAEKKAEEAVPKEDTPKEPRPAAVSTISVEEIRDFDKYPRQVQSLVQSALALTHLELRYMYGSHEPNKGGMDCSGTIYHVLHFQGLKDVPRQSDEMAMWVEKKSRLHLTPTATDFDSPEFADLKPGDLLFWTNTTATTRKLPVTHVMVYLGKRKKDGKRIIFGASDGRSFSGMRRSGVSVFDFNLPRAEGTARLHGYGPAPGLLPAEVVLANARPAAPSTVPAVTGPATPKETAKEPAKVAAMPTKPAVSETKAAAEPKPAKETPVVASSTAAKQPSAPPVPEAKEEVRKAVTVATDNNDMAEAMETPPPVLAAKSEAPKPSTKAKAEPKKVTRSSSTSKSSTASKPSSTTTPKKSVKVSSKRRTPPPPPKSQVEQVFDRAVNSVRRAFR